MRFSTWFALLAVVSFALFVPGVAMGVEQETVSTVSCFYEDEAGDLIAPAFPALTPAGGQKVTHTGEDGQALVCRNWQSERVSVIWDRGVSVVLRSETCSIQHPGIFGAVAALTVGTHYAWCRGVDSSLEF